MRFVERLYAMRLILGIPLYVISGARCPDYNASIGGSNVSAHLIGAADILTLDTARGGIVRAAIAVGMTGIGINRGSVHVDDKHVTLTVWDYYKE